MENERKQMGLSREEYSCVFHRPPAFCHTKNFSLEVADVTHIGM
jgi:hypothetical protein